MTLLAGVDAILAASPSGQRMTLSPWSLGGGGEGGDWRRWAWGERVCRNWMKAAEGLARLMGGDEDVVRDMEEPVRALSRAQL